MDTTITNPKVSETLTALYADAKANDPGRFQSLKHTKDGEITPLERFTAMREIYMPVNRQFGNLLYSLARSLKAKSIVEFGTSFGISTIFLASAIRDNGGGKVITTEFLAEKADRAKKNLTQAGLAEWVDFRVGDAMETLRTNPPQSIDLVLLDGAKGMYFDVLKLLEPHLKPGAIIAADNTDHEGLESFLKHVRTVSNGYVSSAMYTGEPGKIGGHEISFRTV